MSIQTVLICVALIIAIIVGGIWIAAHVDITGCIAPPVEALGKAMSNPGKGWDRWG